MQQENLNNFFPEVSIHGWASLNGISPEFPALLQKTEYGCQLKVLFHGEASYNAWKRSEHDVKDDATLSRNIQFRSLNKSYVLLECDYDYQHGAFHGNETMGEMNLYASYAVQNTDSLSFESVSCMRTSFSGLAEWSNALLLQQERRHQPLTDISLKERDTAEKILDSERKILLSKVRDISQQWASDSLHIQIREKAYIETWERDQHAWRELLSVHRAIKKLVSISGWFASTFNMMEVARDVERTSIESGTSSIHWHPAWSVVDTVKPKMRNIPSGFLFSMEDLDEDWLHIWLELCHDKDCARMIGFLDRLSRELFRITAQEQNWLVGNSLESLGWYLVNTAKKAEYGNLKKNGQVTFVEGVKVILAEVQKAGEIDFLQPRDFPKYFNNAYKGNKHPDREGVDPVSFIHATYQAILLMRVWLGLQLGANLDSMKQRIPQDNLGSIVKMAEEGRIHKRDF
ncbi:HEPN domain-containing protein [Bifidobacterium magnum]|uniref:ApeA N-terminal domain-containing protein n=1 Tax=Bifidobacterium magnum TaxID=1692 RepID=A0A087BBB0_9BIFI|nr:HEPN domain-containing protein [Bifidobacterium magnum]KFI68310.1 hypothetical protein BMAGN_0263 [Bifidobacterium magnum]